MWLAPVQATVLPITDRQVEYARQVLERLKQAGIRATLDDRSEKVNLKIREAQMQKVPYMLVVGDREAQDGAVSVRNRKHGDQGAKAVDDFLADIRKLIDSKRPPSRPGWPSYRCSCSLSWQAVWSTALLTVFAARQYLSVQAAGAVRALHPSAS